MRWKIRKLRPLPQLPRTGREMPTRTIPRARQRLRTPETAARGEQTDITPEEIEQARNGSSTSQESSSPGQDGTSQAAADLPVVKVTNDRQTLTLKGDTKIVLENGRTWAVIIRTANGFEDLAEGDPLTMTYTDKTGKEKTVPLRVRAGYEVVFDRPADIKEDQLTRSIIIRLVKSAPAFEVKSSVGGSASLSGSGASTVISTNAEEGYKLGKVTYTYTDKNGDQQTKELKTLTNNQIVFSSIPVAGDLNRTDKKVTIHVTFDEILQDVSVPDISSVRKQGENYQPIPQLSDTVLAKDENRNKVLVTVDGRDASVTAAGTAPIKGRMNDLVKVTVQPIENRKLKRLYYTYIVGGKPVEKDIVVIDSQTAAQTTYCFYMPDTAVSVYAVFEEVKAEGEEPGSENQGSEQTAQTAADAQTAVQNKDGTGKTVGVGASFAFTYGEDNILAYIGENRVVTAGALAVRAEAAGRVKTASVSGTDPMTGGNAQAGAAANQGNTQQSTNQETGTGSSSKAKDISLDASVAISILENEVKAGIAPTAVITTTGEDVFAVPAEEKKKEAGDEAGEGSHNGQAGSGDSADAGSRQEEKQYNFLLYAGEKAASEVKASGFAMGSSTAVGAAVAVNIVDTGVSADFSGTGTVSGSALVLAKSHSEDVSDAIATAVGADIQRYLDKFAAGENAAANNINKVTSGQIFNPGGQGSNGSQGTDGGQGSNGGQGSASQPSNDQNRTATQINKKVNDKSDPGAEEADKANNNKSLSSGIMGSQNTKTGSTKGSEGTVSDGAGRASEGADLKDGNGNPQTISAGTGTADPMKLQVAAAVGLTVSTHEVNTRILGNLTTGGSVAAGTVNDGNFRTLGTGASIALAANSNSIAAGVAVSVNNNTSKTLVTVSVDSGDDAAFTADLTQNMDDSFRGKLAAQSLAGAVSGANSTLSVGGAISVLVSNAETGVTIGNGQKNGTKVTSQGAMTISASDKSKLSARAGGVSISKGSSVGVGASVVTIVSNNKVESSVQDNARITAKRLQILAERRRVDFSDFISPVSPSLLLTDSSALTDEQRKEANTGIIDIHKGENEESYKVEINVTSDKLLEAVDLLNFLSFTNYYAESIAGSIMSAAAANSDASVAGSMSVLYFNNIVHALVGKNAAINVTGSDAAADGDPGDGMELKAVDGSNVRMIAGAWVFRLKNVPSAGEYNLPVRCLRLPHPLP